MKTAAEAQSNPDGSLVAYLRLEVIDYITKEISVDQENGISLGHAIDAHLSEVRNSGMRVRSVTFVCPEEWWSQ